ncbi:membrane protein [Microbacterium phage Zooman]|nr:membrane protein [Microbacterium phage Zooman]UDL16587.1 membrane protein [Microbacterium phage Zooman]
MQFSGKTLAWLALIALAAFTLVNSPSYVLDWDHTQGNARERP